ncbi:MAG: hypothetical protein JJU06_00155 [Ectothiorhodospiraceae bacterium]|nr:hypothetical protein [Ectothiorhodospiraceae bacterium]MCH8505714.1 hypothetical protein [Ectothiorhodospiraceae bacterium]
MRQGHFEDEDIPWRPGRREAIAAAALLGLVAILWFSTRPPEELLDERLAVESCREAITDRLAGYRELHLPEGAPRLEWLEAGQRLRWRGEVHGLDASGQEVTTGFQCVVSGRDGVVTVERLDLR